MLITLIEKLTNWWQRQMTIQRLEALDDHLLNDLGTTREDIACFIDNVGHC